MTNEMMLTEAMGNGNVRGGQSGHAGTAEQRVRVVVVVVVVV